MRDVPQLSPVQPARFGRDDDTQWIFDCLDKRSDKWRLENIVPMHTRGHEDDYDEVRFYWAGISHIPFIHQMIHPSAVVDGPDPEQNGEWYRLRGIDRTGKGEDCEDRTCKETIVVVKRHRSVQSVRVGGGAKDFIYDHSIEGNKSEDQADEAAFLWRTTLIANQDNTGKECPFVGSLL